MKRFSELKIGMTLLSLLAPFAIGAGSFASESSQIPNTVVVRVPLDTNGLPSPRFADVMGLHIDSPIIDEASAKEAAAAAEEQAKADWADCQSRMRAAVQRVRAIERNPSPLDMRAAEFREVVQCNAPCSVKAQYAREYYRRSVRSVDPRDLRRVQDLACEGIAYNQDYWRFEQNHAGYRIYGRGGAAGFQRGLAGYYPGFYGISGTHPNYNIPLFGVGYNGVGNPFDVSGYLLTPGYMYWFYGAPRFAPFWP